MPPPDSTHTLTDITPFVLALAQLAQAFPHHIDFTSTVNSAADSIIFSDGRRQLPKLHNTPHAAEIVSSLLHRYPGKLRIDGRIHRSYPQPGIRASVTKPEGSFETTPEQSFFTGAMAQPIPVHMPAISAVIPTDHITEIAHRPSRPVQTFRHLAPEHSTRRISRYRLHQLTPEYTLNDVAFQRTQFLLHGKEVLAALHPDDVATLDQQARQQVATYVSNLHDKTPSMTPEFMKNPQAPPGEYLIFTISQDKTVHADLNHGIIPVELQENWMEHRAEYASLARAINLDDTSPYVVVFRKADELPSRKRPRPHLVLDHVELTEHNGTKHEIDWTNDYHPTQLPKTQYKSILMTATRHDPNGVREQIFVNTDLLVVYKYDDPQAAISNAYTGDAKAMANSIFDCVWDYDEEHGDYTDDDILHLSRVITVSILEGDQQAFTAELQHLTDNFSPNAARPNHPVTVSNRLHSITWTPV